MKRHLIRPMYPMMSLANDEQTIKISTFVKSFWPRADIPAGFCQGDVGVRLDELLSVLQSSYNDFKLS